MDEGFNKIATKLDKMVELAVADADHGARIINVERMVTEMKAGTDKAWNEAFTRIRRIEDVMPLLQSISSCTSLRDRCADNVTSPMSGRVRRLEDWKQTIIGAGAVAGALGGLVVVLLGKVLDMVFQ